MMPKHHASQSMVQCKVKMDYPKNQGLNPSCNLSEQWGMTLDVEKLMWSHVHFLDLIGGRLWDRTHASRISRSSR